MSRFNLERFKNGETARTQKRQQVKFICILPESTPARLLVDIHGAMVNYYLDGTYLGAENPSDDDLVMAGYFD
jgi:hypothetical protein